ncbi:RNA cytidine acetyltransferase [Entamoeba marina]
MSKKRVDPRLKTLLENGVKTHERSLVMVVGSKGVEQVMNLYYMHTKAANISKDSVLWCYKKDLAFSSNQKKRLKHKKKAKGEAENSYELFLSTTDIRYVYYHESHKILGNTFGMVILQDFEAITPNILARTIETVRGGGLVVVLLTNITSIKQLYNLKMDIHERYRSEETQNITSRFNERFVLSLADNVNSIVVSDELDIVPLFTHNLQIEKIEKRVVVQQDLLDMREAYKDVPYLNEIVNITTTSDQAKCVVSLFDSLKEKTLNSTISITAGRGRGKSAALGLSISCAIALGYSNVFVTAPSPENVQTVFEFAVKGLEIFGMKEHLDYDIVQTTKTEYGKAVIRVNIHQNHRQTIQYILPHDVSQLNQAELLVIDEAAAIPLPLVKNLLGNYLIMLSTTTNGYEGTGRSLSLKLVKELREGLHKSSKNRTFHESTLSEPIRYSMNDKVELWLNKLLCLDASNTLKHILETPSPEQCDLYIVNRDTLFSYNKEAEDFLQQLQGLFVTSHYKNTPNDLQLLADSPTHMIFILTGPIRDSNELPDILAAVQLSLEGGISKEKIAKSWFRGKKEAGDLIPWTLTQQFLDDDFAQMTGGRVVRICSHPDVTTMGYGSRILQLLELYFTGCIVSLGEMEVDNETNKESDIDDVTVRKELQPLLINPGNRKPEHLDYLGVAYGYTPQLYKFWNRNGYEALYIRLTSNDITGEHSCIMSKQLTNTNNNWQEIYTKDFRKRFSMLLGYEFKEMQSIDALKLLLPQTKTSTTTPSEVVLKIEGRDYKRLEYYSKNLIDYHIVLDVIPKIAQSLIDGIDLQLNITQQVILIGMGLQFKSVDIVSKELKLSSAQVMALFNKAIRKVLSFLSQQNQQQSQMEIVNTNDSKPSAVPMDDISDDGDNEVVDKDILRQRAMKLKELGIDDDDMFKINQKTHDLKDIENLKGRIPSTLSVQRKEKMNVKPSVKYPQKPKTHKKSKHFDKKKSK